MKKQKEQKNQTILKKKNNIEGIVLPDFKIYDKATRIKSSGKMIDISRSMEHNGNPRSRPTQIYSTDFNCKSN